MNSIWIKGLHGFLVVALLLSCSMAIDAQPVSAAPVFQEQQPAPTETPQELTPSQTPLIEIPALTETPEEPRPTPSETPLIQEPASTETPQEQQLNPSETPIEQEPSPTPPDALPGMTASEAAPATPLPAESSPQILPAAPFAQSQLSIDYNPDTKLASFVRAPAGYAIQRPMAAQASAQGASQSFMGQYGNLFGLKNPSAEVRSIWTRKTEGKRSILRYQQIYQGIPVFGAELNINLDAAYNLISLNGKTISNIDLSLQPKVDAAAAIKTASDAMAKKYALKTNTLTASLPELWIYNPVLTGNGGDHNFLAYRMNLTSSERADLKELVFIDTYKGSVLLSFNSVEPSKLLSTYTMNHNTNEAALPGTLVCTQADLNCTAGDTDAKKAHLYASQTYDFYSTYHGRDSINNAGMTIKSSVHLGSGYENAYWDGVQMVYGDGFAIDDVVGHELTHGVTEYTSNLIYQNQSGAINESFSDVWGEFVDLTNSSGTDTAAVRWLMGEDLPIGAIRNMEDPTTFNNPDRMSSPYYYTGSGDNGGVHYNSGVNNKAAYLMTDGDTFNGYTISGMGIPKVAKIYYEAQTNILVSSSTYLDLYNALYQGCQNLIGSSSITADDCQNVRKATLAVEMNQSGGPPPPANDDFDSSIAASPLPYQDQKVTEDATTASDDPSPSNCGAYGDGHKGNSVWYRYRATSNSPVIFNTLNSDYDTVLSVWKGSRGTLTQVSCNDDANNSLTSQIILTPSSGTTYYVMVSGYSGGGSLKFKSLVAPTCYALNKIPSPSTAGTITASPSYSSGCTIGKYKAGQVITLTAKSNLNYHFERWNSTLVNATTNRITIPVKNITIYGYFGANLKKGIYDDTYTGLHYSNYWNTGIISFYREAVHYTYTRGSSVTINFTGTRLGIYYNAGRTYGKAVIQIDTRPPVILNEHSLATTFRNVWWSPALTFGNHKAVITYYNGNPTTTPINFDGVVIQ